MKDEYDFSNAERGKFYRPGAQLIPPVHLDPEVLSYLAARAEARGMSLNDLVNELLRKDIELIEAASVLTHSFDTPETASSSARLPRAFFSRMILALAVHLKGFGLALRWASQISMAASRSATLLNTPRRIVWRVISANSRSTRLIQDDDVGVKCSLKRGCLASQACTSLVLWVL